MNKEKRNEQGFTMIELIVVVAIMGIIGALLVPAFGKMSAKAKLTTDITTVKTLQRQIDVFQNEQASALSAYSAGALNVLTVSDLAAKGYLDVKDLKVSGAGYEVQLQTGGAVSVVAGTGTGTLVLKLNLAGTTVNQQVKDYISNDVKATDPMAGWLDSTGITFKP